MSHEDQLHDWARQCVSVMLRRLALTLASEHECRARRLRRWAR
jgi:hypothetical protein